MRRQALLSLEARGGYRSDGQGHARKTAVWHLEGKVIIHDPDWWKPMAEEEAEAFVDGR
jgi:hypothetical protein